MPDPDILDLSRARARIVTDLGTLVIGFHADRAPGHVQSFCRLTQDGFYDGLAFHRVVRNFVVQGGCPNTRDGANGVPGTGGPGFRLPAEFNDLPHVRGVVSMARSADPNSAGSQFFIVQADALPSLDGKYTVFGRVVEGLDVLDAIAAVDCEFGPGGERSVPKSRIGIRSVELFEGEPLVMEAVDSANADRPTTADSAPEEA
ncbi:MAG: peptidylprolyl isomerase [Planctomycetota bacterium]